MLCQPHELLDIKEISLFFVVRAELLLAAINLHHTFVLEIPDSIVVTKSTHNSAISAKPAKEIKTRTFLMEKRGGKKWVFADADGAIFIAAGHLPAIYEQADQLLEREENLITKIRKGTSLSEMIALEAFLEKRAKDPNADFNAHLAEHDQTI